MTEFTKVRDADEALYGLVDREEGDLRPRVVALNARVAVYGERSALADALALVAPHSSARAWLHTRAGKNGQADSVVLRGQDGKASVQVTLAGHVEVRAHGACALPAKDLAKIVRLMPDPAFTIEVIGSTMTVRSGRAVWSLPISSESSFESGWPSLSGAETTKISGEALGVALSEVSSAVAQGQARPALTQVAVAGDLLIATDGQRLHSVRVDGLPSSIKTSIPGSVASSLSRMAVQADGDVLLATKGHLVALVVPQAGQAMIVQRPVVSSPPGIKGMVTQALVATPHRLVVERELLMEAIVRVRVMADPDNPALSLSLETLSSRLYVRVQARRADTGAMAYERVPAQWHGPDEARSVTVHHKHLMDMLPHLTDRFVTLHLGDDIGGQKAPVVLQEGDFIGWVQQMRDIG